MGKLELLSTRRTIVDDDDIKHIAQHDPRRALGLVVHKYRDRIFNHACYVLKDYQRAADVTQEVFIKAMRETRFFTPDFKMKAWLFRVTSNLCFNIVRDRKRRSGLLEQNPPPKCVQANQVEFVYADERQKRILQAIDRLSPKHSEILKLRYYSDLSYAEIAEALEIKLGTVMSRLSRAKGRLTEVLDDPRVVQG